MAVIARLRTLLQPNKNAASPPATETTPRDRVWGVVAFTIIAVLTYLLFWLPMLCWRGAPPIQRIFKMRDTFLAFESKFDIKDILAEVTSCLDIRVRNRKAAMADVVFCLNKLGMRISEPSANATL